MWNYALKSPHSEITNPDELRVLHTFTGTRDEEWFYLISTTIEASGAAVILELLRCIKAVEEKDSTTVASSLQNATTGIEKLGRLLDRMHEHCDPQVFYHNIRPFLAGSKGMVFAGMPKGVFYDTGDSSAQWRQYSGGSNAQSSLIQFFDIALGVNHYSTGLTSSPGSSNSQNIENSYITVSADDDKFAYDSTDGTEGNEELYAESSSSVLVSHRTVDEHSSIRFQHIC